MIQQTPDRGMIMYLTRAGVPWFLITGAGSPESVEIAPPGSIFIQTDGVYIWSKFSGTGNTGWFKLISEITFQSLTASRPLKLDASNMLISDQIDLTSGNDVKNELGIVNGGTGASSAASARTNLSVYSIAQVNTLLAGKATAGASTGSAGTPAHTHSQT